MWLDLPPGARAWKPRAEVDEARLIRTVDLRTVFATVCDRRPGVDQQAALRSAYETLPIFKT